MHSREHIFVAVVSLACIAPGSSRAQAPVERMIPDRIACGTCVIERTTVARLRSYTLEGEIDELPLAVRRSPNGEIWVLSQGRAPRVYTAAGVYNRTVGRTGDGPGEFRSADEAMWSPGDSTLIFDGIGHRATMFSREGRPGRSIVIPSSFLSPVVISWPTRVLAFANLYTPSATGHVLHLIDLSGSVATVERSFSPEGRSASAIPRSATNHFIVRTADERFHSATPRAHKVFEWTAEGALKSTIARQAPWFPPPPERILGTPTVPPSAMAAAFDVDADGLIWFYVLIPSPEWRTGWPVIPPGVKELPIKAFEWPRLYNTRVEVIDPQRGEVLARAEIPGMVHSTMSGGLAVVFGRSGGDEAEVRIDRLTLRRTRRP